MLGEKGKGDVQWGVVIGGAAKMGSFLEKGYRARGGEARGASPSE